MPRRSKLPLATLDAALVRYAVYLELARHRKLPLAPLDVALVKAARGKLPLITDLSVFPER